MLLLVLFALVSESRGSGISPLVSFFSVTLVCLVTELLVLMTLASIMMESMTFVLPLTLKPYRGLEGMNDTE